MGLSTRWTSGVCAFGLLLMPIACPAAMVEGQTYFNPQLLVSPAWLAEHGDDPGVRVLDVGRTAEDYALGHVPGAVLVESSELAPAAGQAPGTSGHVAKLAETLGAAGVGNHTTVVLYDDGAWLPASRAFWLLELAGHNDVRILDGGWRAWQEEDFGVSVDPPVVPEAQFLPSERPDRMATKAWVLAHLDDPAVALVDTRSAAEYSGEDRRAARGGHIPGAVNVEWTTGLLAREPRTMRPAHDLTSLFDGLAVTKDMVVITYCQAGVRASHAYFVLRLLGYPTVAVYDASWAEWGNDPDAPVTAGSAPREPAPAERDDAPKQGSGR